MGGLRAQVSGRHTDKNGADLPHGSWPSGTEKAQRQSGEHPSGIRCEGSAHGKRLSACDSFLPYGRRGAFLPI